MAQSECVEFLRTELARWRDARLIDNGTYERLQALYAPSLSEELEQEAEFHLELEQRIAAERAPVREEPLPLGAAASEAVRDVASFRVHDRPPPRVVHSVIERDARVAPRWRPLLYEHALWLAGGLLVVFGSLYFLGLNWSSLGSLGLRAVIAAGLTLYAAGFFGVGFALCRRGAHPVGRTLFAFAAALLPLGSVAVGELAAGFRGASFTWLAPLCVALLLAIHGPTLAVMSGLFEIRGVRPLVTSALVLGLLTASIAALALVSPLWVALALGIGVGVFAWGIRSAADAVRLRMSAVFVCANLLWALVVLVGRAATALGGPITHYAPLLAFTCAVLILADHRLRERTGAPVRLGPVGLGLHAGVLVALAASIAGLATVGYLDLGARLSVLASALIAVFVFARGALLHGRSALTYLAASAGLFAYFFLPAPFIGLMRLVERWASNALGYSDEPLPIAYYGITFFPYLVALAAIGMRAERRRPDLARDLGAFCGVIGTLAALLALTSPDDLRPMLFTWPLYAASAFALGRRFGRRFVIRVGHVLGAAWCIVIGVFAASANVTLIGLYAYGVIALALSAWFGAVTTLALALPLTALLHPQSAPALIAVGCASFVLAPRGAKSRKAWRAISMIAIGVGLAACAIQALPGMPSPALWGLLGSLGGALFSASLAFEYRRLRPLWSNRALFATGVAAALSVGFAIEIELASIPLEQRVWAHGVALALQSIAWRLGRRQALCVALLLGPTSATLAALAIALFRPIPLGIGSLACGALCVLGLIGVGWRRVALALACALPTLGVIVFAPSANLTLPLALTALALTPLVSSRLALPLAWPLALAGLSLFASRLELARIEPFIATSCIALVLISAWRGRKQPSDHLGFAAAIAVTAAVAVGVVFLAAVLSTGRHPPAALLAPIAGALLANAIALSAVGARSRRSDREGFASVGRGVTVLAAACAIGALAASPRGAPKDALLLAGFTALAAIAVMLLRAFRDRNAWLLDAAWLAFAAAYGFARTQGLPGSFVSDALLAIAFGHAAVWLLRPGLARPALRRIAAIAPAAAPILALGAGLRTASLIALLSAVHYAVMSRTAGNKLMSVPAGVFADAALFFSWSALGLDDSLAYALPIALTLLVLIHVYADELGARARRALRVGVLVTLYAVCIGSALGGDPLRALVIVPAICVAAIACGALLRVRVYLVLGLAFLAVDLGLEMLRHGLENRPLGALFLSVLGLGLVFSMVVFSLERERVLKRYSQVLGELATWD